MVVAGSGSIYSIFYFQFPRSPATWLSRFVLGCFLLTPVLFLSRVGVLLHFRFHTSHFPRFRYRFSCATIYDMVFSRPVSSNLISLARAFCLSVSVLSGAALCILCTCPATSRFSILWLISTSCSVSSLATDLIPCLDWIEIHPSVTYLV